MGDDDQHKDSDDASAREQPASRRKRTEARQAQDGFIWLHKGSDGALVRSVVRRNDPPTMNPTADLHAPNLGKQTGSGELRRLRREADLSQAELGRQLDVSRATIYRMEQGKIAVDTDMLDRIARLYRMDVARIALAAVLDRRARLDLERLRRHEKAHGEETP